MVAVSGVSVNVGMLPRCSLFTLFLGARMTQPLFYLSRSGVTVMSIRVPVTIGTDWDRQTRQGTWPTGVLLDVRLHYSTVWCRHTWTGYRWVNSSTTVAAQSKLVIHKSCPERRVSSPQTLSDYSYAIACIRLGNFKALAAHRYYSAVTVTAALWHLQGCHHLSHCDTPRLQLETLQNKAS